MILRLQVALSAVLLCNVVSAGTVTTTAELVKAVQEGSEGDTIQIALTASNDGASSATGLAFSAALPSGLTLESSQPQTGSYDSTTGVWTVGELGAGEVTRLVLNARVDQRGIKIVPVELISANEFDIDSTPGNAIATEDDRSEVVVRAPRLLTSRLFFSR